MTRDVAKFILRAYRVDGQDQSDPQFAEALDMVKRDPELARWFAEEQAMDSRLARSFGTFPVPPDLKTQLLAARKVIVVPVWQRRPVWLAAAAGIAILLGLVFVPRTPRSGPSLALSERSELLRLAGQGPHVNMMAASFPAIQTWLRERQMPAELALSEQLKGQHYKGCRILEWQGRRVTMMCLGLEGRHVDLFVLDAGLLPGLPGDGQPQFARVGDVNTAAWSRGGQTYLLAGQVDPQTLKRYL
ncbi:MAG: hypothetical protein WCS99_01325 [Limisphaerales bacterium]